MPKKDEKTIATTVVAEATSEVVADQFHGQGGSYIVNATTGERELVSRTGMDEVTESTATAEVNGGDHADAI